MAVLIGHASIDENNRAKNGRAGDQTLKEVCTRNWYNKPWTCVIRPKDTTVAERIAKAMEQACKNNNIGYDQGERTTLYAQAKKHSWDLSKINTKCETDCSALVSVCVNAAGITVSKDMYTGNELAVLKATGKFDILTSRSYIASSNLLRRGDILLGNGHTAIVLGNSSSVSSTPSTNTEKTDNTKVEIAKQFSKSVAGTYVTTANLHLRQGAGSNKKSIVIIPDGTKVQCYGYYNIVGSAKWLLIVVIINGVKYTGYSSANYLKR